MHSNQRVTNVHSGMCFNMFNCYRIFKSLVSCCCKCCQQDPAARYQNCAELMYDLEHVEEMNYSARASRRKKWLAFIASVGVFLLGVAGVIGFTAAKNSATKETYDYYVYNAQQEMARGDFESFIENVENAIEIDPAQYEAYDVLLNQIESDGYMDKQTELAPLQQCLQRTSDGYKQSNENLLLERSPEDYAKIQFRVGKLLFLMSDGQDADLSASVIYFDNAINRGRLSDDSGNAGLAEALATIGRHINSLHSSTNYYLDQDYSYQTLWEDLDGLIEDNPIDSLGGKAYGIALYSRVASMILDKYKEFANTGVSVDDMLELLDQIGASLDEMSAGMTESEINRGFGTLIENAYFQNDQKMEKVITMLYNMVEDTMGKHNLKFAPYIGTIFVSSIFGSIIGMTQIFRSSTADLSVTMAWALVTTGMVWYQNIKHQGLGPWLKGFTEPIFIMTPMNVISEIASPLSLAFRHFGNVAGGGVLTSLVYAALAAASNLLFGWLPGLLGSIPFLQAGLPAILSIYFDLFSGFVQAFVFCLLTMVYVGTANPPPEELPEKK